MYYEVRVRGLRGSIGVSVESHEANNAGICTLDERRSDWSNICADGSLHVITDASLKTFCPVWLHKPIDLLVPNARDWASTH